MSGLSSGARWRRDSSPGLLGPVGVCGCSVAFGGCAVTWRDPAPGVPECPVCCTAEGTHGTNGDDRGRLFCDRCWLFFNGGQAEWESYAGSRKNRQLRAGDKT